MAGIYAERNTSEPETLQTMLKNLDGRAGSTVVLDAGLASEENIQWLIEQGYRYWVVSRKRKRDFDADNAVVVKDGPGLKGQSSTCHL